MDRKTQKKKHVLNKYFYHTTLSTCQIAENYSDFIILLTLVAFVNQRPICEFGSCVPYPDPDSLLLALYSQLWSWKYGYLNLFPILKMAKLTRYII